MAVHSSRCTASANLSLAWRNTAAALSRLKAQQFSLLPARRRGKYVPSLGHFILSQAATLGGTRSLGQLAGRPTNPARPSDPTARLATLQRRPLPPHLLAQRPLLREPPLFDLRGLAIGNGLTDPAAQASSSGLPCWSEVALLRMPELLLLGILEQVCICTSLCIAGPSCG